jgi:uncharacterized membrane protein
MHASTRILLILAAGATIVTGWWVLLAINRGVVGVVYGLLWTLVVLIVARVLAAVGFGYNRFAARRGRGASSGGVDAATTLAELDDLRDRGLISPEEYAAKRSKVVERL